MKQLEEEEKQLKKEGYSDQEISLAKTKNYKDLRTKLQDQRQLNFLINSKYQLERDMINKDNIIEQQRLEIQDLKRKLAEKTSENESLIRQLGEISDL